MGSRGPLPKRSSQRRRMNKESVPEKADALLARVAVPAADAGWHPVASAWYCSLSVSGQSRFYEPSDWSAAFLIAESMSRDLKPQVVAVKESGEPVFASVAVKGASLTAYLKAMTLLLVTEGDRRRARLELQRVCPDAAADGSDVSELDEYRRRLTK